MTDAHPFSTATAVATATLQTTVRIPCDAPSRASSATAFHNSSSNFVDPKPNLTINFPHLSWKLTFQFPIACLMILK